MAHFTKRVSQQNQPGWWDRDHRTHPEAAPAFESGDDGSESLSQQFPTPHIQIPVYIYLSLKNFLVMFYIISICLCSGVPVCFEYPMVLCLGSIVLAVRLLFPQETVDFPGASLVLNPG